LVFSPESLKRKAHVPLGVGLVGPEGGEGNGGTEGGAGGRQLALLKKTKKTCNIKIISEKKIRF